MIAFDVDVRERLETDVLGAVDGLGDGAVDQRLRGCLHGQMIGGRQRLGANEQFGRGRDVALGLAPDAHRIILDLLLAS